LLQGIYKYIYIQYAGIYIYTIYMAIKALMGMLPRFFHVVTGCCHVKGRYAMYIGCYGLLAKATLQGYIRCQLSHAMGSRLRHMLLAKALPVPYTSIHSYIC